MKNLFKNAFLMLAVLLPAIAFAYDFEVDGIYYIINGSNASITYKCMRTENDDPDTAYPYSDYSGDIIIPTTVKYNGITYTVTSISDYAFYNCSSLTSINIPNSVSQIGVQAFMWCSGLTHMIIPNSVTSIGAGAFTACTGLTDVSISNALKVLEYGVFTYCCSLTNIIIPNSVTHIGELAICDCPNLANVTIPNSVITIEGGAFRNCTSLTNIIIPSSVTSIASSVVEGCSNLKNITVESGNTTYDSRNNCNGIIETATNTLIVGCNSTIIPNSVYHIGNDAFYFCSDLTSVTIPNSVLTIGEHAFHGCSGLTNITIPNSVSHIGDHAFCFCSGLTNVTLPNSITYIGREAFFDCELNEVYSNITEPDIVSMGSSVFEKSYYNSYNQRTLYIPHSTLAAYQADIRWSPFFGNIVELEPQYPILTSSIELNVTAADMAEGRSLQLMAKVLPEDATNKVVIWTSTNESVATVDKNGLVTAISSGSATISVRTTDGSNLSATCFVSIKDHASALNGDVNGDRKINISDVTDLIDLLLSSGN